MDIQNPPPTPKPGQISWNELTVSNAAAAKRFYNELFGWTSVPFAGSAPVEGMPPYEMFLAAGVPLPVGGMIQIPFDVPGAWVPYVVVANVDEALAKAVALGAVVCAPVMVVPTVGRVAVIQDPSGARIGLHELAV